jgi:hypothetical protein
LFPVATTRGGRQHQTLTKHSISNLDQNDLMDNFNDTHEGFQESYISGSWTSPAQWQAAEANPGHAVPDQWSHDGSQGSPTLPFEDPQPIKDMYLNAIQLDSINSSDAVGFYQPVTVMPGDQSQFVDRNSGGYENDYTPDLPPYIDAIPPNCEPVLGMFQPTPYYNSASNQHEQPMWLNSTYMNQGQTNTIIHNASTTVQSDPSPLKLYWPTESNEFPVSAPKRKRTSPEPSTKRSRATKPVKPLSEFVVVFENSPGALLGVKHRRKLDDPVRKAARDVRKAGACHQCRFRKRTVSPSTAHKVWAFKKLMLCKCSTGSPCISCLKNGNGLHEVKCQRESPFVGKLMHQCRIETLHLWDFIANGKQISCLLRQNGFFPLR